MLMTNDVSLAAAAEQGGVDVISSFSCVRHWMLTMTKMLTMMTTCSTVNKLQQ